MLSSWLVRLFIFGVFVSYVFIFQLYRLHSYLHSSTPLAYAEALSAFPTNPGLIWTKPLPYLREPGLVIRSPICQKKANREDGISILVVVLSKPARFETRLAIRASWASYFREHLPRNSAVFFVVGVNASRTEVEQRRLQSEIDHYNDLLIVDLLESYHNLSLKTVSAFRWIDEKCKGAMTILKTDDDVVIFGPNLLRYLRGYYSGERTDHVGDEPIKQPEIHCYVYRWSKAFRERRPFKYFVPFEHYPARYYQPHCSGHAYVLTRSGLQHLLLQVKTLNVYSHLEDVLLTGIVAQKAAVKLISRNEFHGEHYDSKYPYPPSDPRWRYVFDNYFSVHCVRKGQNMMEIWREFTVYCSGRQGY